MRDALPPNLEATLDREQTAAGAGWDPAATLGARVIGPPAPGYRLPQLGVPGDATLEPQYRFGEPLGRGATAIVYSAEHLPLARTVAVKALRPELGGRAAADALIDEARITGGLEHPNIVPVHALGLDGAGRPLLVMKRVDGEPWSAVLGAPDHPLWRRWPGDTLDRAVQIGLRIADALSAAHGQGVLHRDIKPSNVVLGYTGEVYLVDWGIAARLGSDGRLVAPLAGTPAYMAPEMFDAGRPLDVRSDVYLLGATLYAALGGRPPREGRALTALARAAHRPPPPLPGVAGELAAIVARAMDPEPDGRFSDVEALRAALVAFLDHRSALDLAARAEVCRRRWTEVDGDALDATARDGLFAEARFGYRAALAAWPDCAPARRGLEQLIEAGVAADLARGDVAAARRSVAELPGPRPDLEAAVRAAEAGRDAERAELDAARAGREALDSRAGTADRRRWLPLMLLLVVLGPIRVGIWRLAGTIAPDFVHPMRGVAPLLLAAAVEVHVRRRPGEAAGQVFNRNLLRACEACLAGVGLLWLHGALTGGAAERIVFGSLVLQGAVFGAAALILDRRFGLMVASAGASAVAGVVAPAAAELALGLHLLVAVIGFERMWTR